MFCSKCGTELAADSKFCSKCGKAIETQLPVKNTMPQSPSLESAPQSRILAGLTKKQILTMLPWALIIIILNAGKLMMASVGEIDVDGRNAFILMFLTGGVFWYFWKVCNRQGWVGGVVGVAVSILIIMLSAVGAGYVRGQPEYILEHTAPYPVIKKRFPKEYDSMYQDLVAAAKEKKLTAEYARGMLDKEITPLLNQSLNTTSDPALLLFTKAKLSLLREVAKNNPEDCYTLMSGAITDADPATQIRISKYISPETRALLGEAMQKVIEESGTYWETLETPTIEKAHFNHLLAQLNTVLTNKYSSSVYYFTDDSLGMPVDIRCKAGIALWEETMNLSSDDRIFMLRRFFDSESKF